MSKGNKPLAWLHGEVKTPPFLQEARIEAGVLLRTLQQGLAQSPGAGSYHPSASASRGIEVLFRPFDDGYSDR